MKINYLIWTFIAILLSGNVGWSSHIVGGYMKYECVESGIYHVTLTVYRNCNSQAQNDFDLIAPITIYRGNVGEDYELVNDMQIALNKPVFSIPTLLNNPCIEPPSDLCLEVGTYDFEVNLPVSSKSYHVTYQRCCRNWNISNIDEAGRVGSTFTIEITPAGQSVCNSSPDFIDYPPPLICANQPWIFDHSASDLDGDQLVYEFCSPLNGAGLEGISGNGDPTGCDGFRPNPSCAPPYENVEFILPEYTAIRPMGGNPVIAIDPFTGEITGTPEFEGQYSIGVCVSEFRNGQLMSVLRRDVQFTVVKCAQLVDAILDPDVFDFEDNTYSIKQCVGEALVIDNFSIGENVIDDFFWEFSGNGTSWTFDSWDINLGILEAGHYDGILFLNRGAVGCSDSTFLSIDIFEKPEAKFLYSYDTCSVDPINFSDASIPFGGEISEWDWDFGGAYSDEQNPSYQFPEPGDFQIKLAVEDVNECTAAIEQFISWFPAPEVIVIEPNSFDGCSPLNIGFENLSWPIDESYELFWDFGSAGQSDQISPFVNFEDIATYDVSLKIISPFNCEISEKWDQWITVHPNPTSSFEVLSEPEDMRNPNALLQTTSPDGRFWDWVIEGQATQYGPEANIVFQDTGYWNVLHVVENEFGCLDSVYQSIYVKPYNNFFLPNAFTPNGDGKNELFMGKGVLMGSTGFSLTVWNRYGQQVFQTDSPNVGWNGTVNNVGKRAVQGAYPFELQYTRFDEQIVIERGLVTLLR